MSIYLAKRKDGSLKSPYWQFDFVLKINGERRRFHGSTGETKERAAREWEQKEKSRVKSEGPLDHMTLAAACYRYSAERGPNIATADDQDKAFEHCCRLIGSGKRLVNITAEDIASAVRARSLETVGARKPRSIRPATVNRQIVEPLQRLMRRARVVWKVNCDPTTISWSDLKLKEPQGRTRELTSEESKLFWKNLRADYLPFVWFLAARGLRVRAAIGMQKFDVDLKRKTANVWKKGVGKVKIHLSEVQCTLIRDEMAKCPSSKAVWTYAVQRGSKKGQRSPITYDGLRRVLSTALSQSGITDFHIHDLRHDFASKLLRSSRNLALVQKALGHSDIKSTVRYAHVLDDEVAEAMDAMAVPELSRKR